MSTLACAHFCMVHPEGLEPPTTDPKSVMISISPWVRVKHTYHTLKIFKKQRLIIKNKLRLLILLRLNNRLLMPCNIYFGRQLPTKRLVLI